MKPYQSCCVTDAAFLIKFHDGTFFRSPPKADPEVASDEEENAPEMDLAPTGSFKRLRNASQIMVDCHSLLDVNGRVEKMPFASGWVL